mgnify:CR=1 FL=1
MSLNIQETHTNIYILQLCMYRIFVFNINVSPKTGGQRLHSSTISFLLMSSILLSSGRPHQEHICSPGNFPSFVGRDKMPLYRNGHFICEVGTYLHINRMSLLHIQSKSNLKSWVNPTIATVALNKLIGITLIISNIIIDTNNYWGQRQKNV